MPYTLEDGDIVEVRVNYVQNGQRMLNVMHYRMVGSGIADEGGTDVQETAANVAAGIDQWVANWLEQGSSNCTILSVDAQKIYPNRYPFRRTVVNEAGSSASASLPQNVQLSIEKVGELANRHGIGRIEVPGITVDKVSDGLVTAAGADWLAELSTSALLPIIAPFEAPTALVPILYNRATPLTSQLVTGMRLGNTSRVARRRTVGVGQ